VAVAHRLPGSVLLSGPAATRAAVLAALPDHPWLHLACHAHADPGRSAASHLLLHDGPLGVRDIAQLSLDGQELAFLSACGTGRGTAALADESLHLGGAFQLAGYRHVIATHWRVWDRVARQVADMVYDRLLPAPRGGALASTTVAASVHEVTRLLRAADPAKPALWAPYLHLGP
jgi:CHAT domain-containing protein